MSLEVKIREILKEEKENRVLSVAADVLRALVILHGSAWRSDLMDTLTGLWSIKGLDAGDMIDRERALPEALEKLSESGLLRSERRLRADLGRREPVEEELYSAVNLISLIRTLSFDHTIDKYRREVMGYRTLRL